MRRASHRRRGRRGLRGDSDCIDDRGGQHTRAPHDDQVRQGPANAERAGHCLSPNSPPSRSADDAQGRRGATVVAWVLIVCSAVFVLCANAACPLRSSGSATRPKFSVGPGISSDRAEARHQRLAPAAGSRFRRRARGEYGPRQGGGHPAAAGHQLTTATCPTKPCAGSANSPKSRPREISGTSSFYGQFRRYARGQAHGAGLSRHGLPCRGRAPDHR